MIPYSVDLLSRTLVLMSEDTKSVDDLVREQIIDPVFKASCRHCGTRLAIAMQQSPSNEEAHIVAHCSQPGCHRTEVTTLFDSTRADVGARLLAAFEDLEREAAQS